MQINRTEGGHAIACRFAGLFPKRRFLRLASATARDGAESQLAPASWIVNDAWSVGIYVRQCIILEANNVKKEQLWMYARVTSADELRCRSLR